MIEQLIDDRVADIEKWIDLASTDCFHLFSDSEFSLDQLGNSFWIKDYSEDENPILNRDQMADYALKTSTAFFIRKMKNRGSGVGGEEKSTLEKIGPHCVPIWLVKENGLNLQLKADSGFTYGLFLDQRENRLLVQRTSATKRVLNLFAYTGAFSIAAAKGGAQSVTTVDASGVFLDWCKQNFMQNELDPDQYEFYKQDCLLFTQGAVKRNRTWDLIICDPPTFGRAGTQTWKIEKDFPILLDLLWKVLATKGSLLLTCNFEKWTMSDFKKVIQKALPRNIKIEENPKWPLDFGSKTEFESHLKGFIVRKD